MKSEFLGPVAEIPVKDISTAAAYYQASLGFTLDWGAEELGLAGISSCIGFGAPVTRNGCPRPSEVLGLAPGHGGRFAWQRLPCLL